MMTPSMNFQALKELTQKGISVAVGTRNEDLRPAVCEGMALKIADDEKSFSLMIPQRGSAEVIANLKANGLIAVTFSSPFSNEAGQIWGKKARLREVLNTDLEIFKSWRQLFIFEIELIGTSKVGTRNFERRLEPYLVIEAEMSDLFQQTPGPKAGERIK